MAKTEKTEFMRLKNLTEQQATELEALRNGIIGAEKKEKLYRDENEMYREKMKEIK